MWVVVGIVRGLFRFGRDNNGSGGGGGGSKSGG